VDVRLIFELICINLHGLSYASVIAAKDDSLAAIGQSAVSAFATFRNTCTKLSGVTDIVSMPKPTKCCA